MIKSLLKRLKNIGMNGGKPKIRCIMGPLWEMCKSENWNFQDLSGSKLKFR